MALRQYDDGVHEEGAPATTVPLGLPGALATLGKSWDGLRLFYDAVVLSPLASVTRAGERWLIGELDGAPLWLDGDGRVFEADDDGDPILAGSSLPRWLKATVAREAVLVDERGEWREVFDGEELTAQAKKKRWRAGVKADPETARLELDAAELALEADDPDAAVAAAERAVALDPNAGAAWALIGGLHENAAAWARAATAAGNPEVRAERFAEAARAATRKGHTDDAARHAAAALAASPESPSKWAAAADALTSDGDIDGAIRLAERAAAIAPAHASLAARLRARRQLAVT